MIETLIILLLGYKSTVQPHNPSCVVVCFVANPQLVGIMLTVKTIDNEHSPYTCKIYMLIWKQVIVRLKIKDQQNYSPIIDAGELYAHGHCVKLNTLWSEFFPETKCTHYFSSRCILIRVTSMHYWIWFPLALISINYMFCGLLTKVAIDFMLALITSLFSFVPVVTGSGMSRCAETCFVAHAVKLFVSQLTVFHSSRFLQDSKILTCEMPIYSM